MKSLKAHPLLRQPSVCKESSRKPVFQILNKALIIDLHVDKASFLGHYEYIRSVIRIQRGVIGHGEVMLERVELVGTEGCDTVYICDRKGLFVLSL